MHEQPGRHPRLGESRLEPQPLDVFEKDARPDNRLVLELEGGQMRVTAREPRQILECRPLAGERDAGIRPVELAEKPRRIENVRGRPFRPLPFDETDEEHLVELPIPSGLRVEKLDAGGTGTRCECLPFDPSTDHGGQARNRDRRIVQIVMSPPQTMQGRQHRAASAQMPLAQRIACRRNPVVCVEEREQRIELHGGAFFLHERAQLLRRSRGRLRGLPPSGISKRTQPIGASEVPFVAQAPVESGNIGSTKRHTIDLERKVGRAEQRDDGLAREVRRHELEHEIQRGGIGFGGKWQRIECLVWNAGIGKDVTRQIDVRQRALEHDRPPIEIRASGGLDRRGDGGELVLPVAAHRHLPLLRWDREHRPGRIVDDLFRIRRKLGFLETGHEFLEPIEQAGGDGCVRRHDVDLFELRHTRQQIEVGRP